LDYFAIAKISLIFASSIGIYPKPSTSMNYYYCYSWG